MKKWLPGKIIGVAAILVTAVVFLTFTSSNNIVDFNTEVKPIINKKCIACHGGVKREAGFSLLFRSDALAKTDAGRPAIIPGDPDNSELLRRLTVNDPEERMPYQHEPLSKSEISVFRRWISQGAKWGDHWAYLPVRKPALPHTKDVWIHNEVDRFILAKLEEHDLTPSPEADKAVLLRRVSLDLIGMPAPDSLAASFLLDQSPSAYERLVDSLLNSEHFGERWAALWMDLARYSDTKGYERDDARSIWRYRDWLINSFNQDKPYDVFLIEQLAGDLLPNATDEQFIATAFHRNTMTNDEGGTDNEEFRTAAVIDRVNTTWETIMGTTFACVQCHSHPYDPFRHEDYYKFMAFFNNTRDEDTYDDYPLLRSFNDTLQQQLTALTSWLEKNASAEQAKSINLFLRTWQPALNSLTSDHFINSELSDTKWLIFRNNAVARLRNVDLSGKNHLIYRTSCWSEGGIWRIHLDSVTGPVLKTIVPKKTKGWEIVETDIPESSGTHDLYFTYSNRNSKSADESFVMFDWFHFTQDFPAKGKPGYDQNKRLFRKLLNANVPTTPVMMENPVSMRRATYIFERGNWLVKGDEVGPATPASLNPFPADAPRNRLGLSKWITDKNNPLTARTMVNRFWEQLFGNGIAETLEDLGTQGISPTHQQLLDWLSYTFMHTDQWSVKKTLKRLVMSATYRQDSRVSQNLIEKDPNNTLYARGARVRLSAEQIRDQSLVVSGLLSPQLLGPSVMPHQPPGIWMSPWNSATWQNSSGADQNRRALYTYWKRTAPYPSMITFDGAAREVCSSRRIRTNTPLQALVTLNDSAYLNMSRHFAYRMKKGAATPDQQIAYGYTLATYKTISKGNLSSLMKLYDHALRFYQNDKDKTCEMVGLMNEHNNPHTAALVVVANAILNLDEMIMKN